MRDFKIPALGFAGVGSGIAVGTLAGEFTARATGQTKWAACGVKSGVKGGIGLVSYLIGRNLDDRGNASSAFFSEMFAYGALGSILLDVALALYPGGIPGLADDWATTARVYAAGGRKVVKELGKMEREIPKGAAGAEEIARAQAQVAERWL